MRIRSCHFNIELYPDDFQHMIAFDTLEKGGYQFTGILHDKDVKEDSTPVKPHYHCVVVFPRQKDLSALAKELSIEDRWIEPCRNRKQSERYLCHADNPDKYQYPSSDLFGPLADSVRAHLDSGITEEDKVKSLLALLDTMPMPCTYRRFLLACCDAGLYSTFRRLGNTLRYLLDEHNGLSGY